jgi:endonuclease/exonuclease/phosphatase family metal-dependent hydrolase
LIDLVRETRQTRPQLTDCTCPDPDGCGHVQTYRHANKVPSRPVQLDYAFVSPMLASARCTVVDDDDAWSFSDHCPIVIEID